MLRLLFELEYPHWMMVPEPSWWCSDLSALHLAKTRTLSQSTADKNESEYEMKSSPAVRPTTQSDINREFRGHQGIEWRWFMVMLFAFVIINYLAGRG